MSALDALPLRDRPTGLPVPPARMALMRAGRPLKHWRYVGLYGEAVMLCAAQVRIAGLPQAFWAVWDRRELRERTVFRPGTLTLDDDRVRFGAIDLRLEPDGDPMAVTSRHGRSYIWTRKQPVRAVGTVEGEPVELRGLIDDSAGYHARRTDWRWCAGVGETPDGRALAWNLVDGVHDAGAASERTVWVDGEAEEVPQQEFAADLSRVGELDFREWSAREARMNLLIMRNRYRQPFGEFSGRLPGGLALAEGYGVMEEHDVLW
jgi:hypothetical protein